MQPSKFSIAVVIPYFGALPWYFAYFVHSCKKNADINFIFFTDDNSCAREMPGNILLINTTLAKIKALIERKLQMAIALESSYKICDFRPAFGIAFAELLSGYDFWGMGDIDVIFGNIRKFITDEVLENYDVISVRHDFLVGYFTLFRNCRLINELYQHSNDHIKVFTSPEHFCFDESNFAYLKMDDITTFEDVQCEIDSMTHVVKRLQKQNIIRAYFDVHAIEGLPGKLKWENGTLIYRHEYEVILYHMIQFKEIYKPRNTKRVPDVFRISPTRIY